MFFTQRKKWFFLELFIDWFIYGIISGSFKKIFVLFLRVYNKTVNVRDVA